MAGALVRSVVASALLLGAAQDPAPPFAFPRAAQEGEPIARSFHQTLELRLTEYESAVVTDGKESAPQSGPPVELTRSQDERVEFEDRVLALDGARAAALARRFTKVETISTQTVSRESGAPQTKRERALSPLEGKGVRFDWDAQAARYRASFEARAEGEAEPPHAAELLAPLEASADLAWFLPPTPVAPGATWRVSPATFELLSSPSGELALEVDGVPEPTEFGERFHEHLEGRIECRFEGLRDFEGLSENELGRAALVQVSARLDTEFALSDGDRYRFHIELDGELVWDRERGRARGIHLAGPVDLRVETRRPLEGFELVTRQRLAGRMGFEVEFR